MNDNDFQFINVKIDHKFLQNEYALLIKEIP